MTKTNLSSIMRTAHQIRKTDNVSLSAALRKAWALEKLVERMKPLRAELNNRLYRTMWVTGDTKAAQRAELEGLMARYTQLRAEKTTEQQISCAA